jgi:protein-disulfide isomerase
MTLMPSAFFYLVAVFGLMVSILSALETRVNWIASLCAVFGGGCRRTADFTLFRLPVSVWGALYYILLMTTAFAAPPLLFWLIMAGLGFELTFVYILSAIRVFCIFCFLNAFIVAALVIWAFDPAVAWQAAAVALIFFAGSFFLMRQENRSMFFPAKGSTVKAGRKPPADNGFSIEEGGSPTIGAEDAPVKVIEFSDYQCPACRKGKRTTIKILERYNRHIKWVYKNFPLPQHEGAELMAVAAHCAQEQGKFWEYHERLYFMEEKPDTEKLVQMAGELNLDTVSFRICLEKQRYREQIDKDMAAAKKAGVTKTPTYIVNGRFLSGIPSYKKFSRLIESELDRKKMA